MEEWTISKESKDCLGIISRKSLEIPGLRWCAIQKMYVQDVFRLMPEMIQSSDGTWIPIQNVALMEWNKEVVKLE